MEDLCVKLLRGLTDDGKILPGLKSAAQRFGPRTTEPGQTAAAVAPATPGGGGRGGYR